jgi:hypothetical protein
MRHLIASWGFAGLLAVLVALSGCGGQQPQPHDPGGNASPGGASTPAHALHGWWCTEHGVPEEECARCDASLIAGFKAAGDWCDEHARPESQCFVCDPQRFEPFAQRFEAKFGQRPPRPTQ